MNMDAVNGMPETKIRDDMESELIFLSWHSVFGLYYLTLTKTKSLRNFKQQTRTCDRSKRIDTYKSQPPFLWFFFARAAHPQKPYLTSHRK